MEGQAIATDVPCVGCGYNLRMQPVEGACPECGLASKESLDQTILKWGSQRLRRIAQGMRLLAATMLLIPIVLGAGVTLDEVVITNRANSQYMGVATFGVMAVVGMVHAMAAWWATSAPDGDRHTLSRWLCRRGSVMVPLVLFVAAASIAFQRAENGISDYLELSASLLMGGLAIYAERAAAVWAVFHQRGGHKEREGLGKWSMRAFAVAVAGLAVSLGAISLRQIQIRLDKGQWALSARTMDMMLWTLMGTFAFAAFLLVLIVIALARGANRAATLARMAKEAERDGFTAPLAPTTDAPSCS